MKSFTIDALISKSAPDDSDGAFKVSSTTSNLRGNVETVHAGNSSKRLLDNNVVDNNKNVGHVPLNGNSKRKRTVAGSKPYHPMLANVQLKLETRQLWLDFYRLGTEMIVTKSGRYNSFLTI